MTTSYDYTSSARKKTPPGKETSVEKPAAAEATPPPAPAAPAKAEEKPARVDPKKKTKKFLTFIEIITCIVVGWALIWYIDQFAQKKFAQYAMRPWAISMIVTLAVICGFIVTGFFIKAVKPTTNKSFAYAVILGIFFTQVISIIWQEARRDYFDPKTGEPSVWVTDGLQEFWHEKPDFVFSPMTGKPVRLATGEEIPKLPKRGISFNFFEKKPRPARAAPPPDYKIYHPGTHAFSLKTGEMTDHWIMFPAGRNNMGSFSSPDFNYELIFDDGDIVKGDPNAIIPRKNRAKLKIRAISEQPNIKLIVK